MGGCSSTVDEDEREAIETSKKIDKENAKDYLKNSEKIKILLLGAGDSGKSTIFKQMRLLYGEVCEKSTQQSNVFYRLIQMMKECLFVYLFIKMLLKQLNNYV